MRHAGWFLAAIAGAASLIAAARSGDAEQPPAYDAPYVDAPYVGAGFSRPEPPAAPWDPDAVDAGARSLSRLHSLLVSHKGELVFEQYYNGARRDRPANIKSASKSIISALTGIAIERGLIQGLDTPILTYFPELAQDPDPRKRDITVEHLLTMRPGLEGTSNRNYGAWVTSRNWVRHALARPMFAAPGEEMEYSTGSTHLLSAILTKATGRSTWQFANEVLAGPLDFSLPRWPRDPQGIYFGGNDMLMTPRQMLAFGELYLNEGRWPYGGQVQRPVRQSFGEGADAPAGTQQIISESWVEQSCDGRPRNRRRGNRGFDAMRASDPLRDRQYGYGWWVHEIRGYDTCFAWGYGGQYIFTMPDLDLVIATTSSPDVSEERRGHRRALFDVLDEHIVAPTAANSISALPSRTSD